MVNVKEKAKQIISARRAELEKMRKEREQFCLLVLGLFEDLVIIVEIVTIKIQNDCVSISVTTYEGSEYSYPSDGLKVPPDSLERKMMQILKMLGFNKDLELPLKILEEELGEYIIIEPNNDKTAASLRLNDGATEIQKVENEQQKPPMPQEEKVVQQQKPPMPQGEKVVQQQKPPMPQREKVVQQQKPPMPQGEKVVQQQKPPMSQGEKAVQHQRVEVPVVESPIVKSEMTYKTAEETKPNEVPFDFNDLYAVFDYSNYDPEPEDSNK